MDHGATMYFCIMPARVIRKLSSTQEISIYFFVLFLILPELLTLLFWDHHLPPDQIEPKHHLPVLRLRGDFCLQFKAKFVHTLARQSCRKLSHCPISATGSPLHCLLLFGLCLLCHFAIQMHYSYGPFLGL